MKRTSIKITSEKLDLQECYSFVEDASCGGISAFIGVVRNDTQGKEVIQLDFSTYKPMAIKEMQKIADLSLQKFDIHKIAIHHAVGELKIGDIPVIIAVSSAHRKAAFEATQDALQAHDDVSVIFNTGGEEALGALDAVLEANRLNSAPGGGKIIILVNDDSKETVNEVRKGNMDVVVPYTPLLGGIGVRAAILHIGAKEGLNEKVSIKFKDYRDIDKQYTNIASIEMFEAVGKKYWENYFEVVRCSLLNSGKAALQIITIDKKKSLEYQRQPDFIQQYIFPGGMLPTKEELRQINQNLGLDFNETKSFGISYAKTLNVWNNRFQSSWQDLVKQGFNERFKRMWEFYLSYCETGFISKSTDVSHFLIKK